MITDIRVVAAWLADLANVTAGAAMLSDIKPRIGGLASLLAENYPADAFCRASLEHAARECKFFPSYAELCDILSPWWKEHRPTPLAIAGDQSASAEQAERERKDAESWRGMTAGDVRAKVRALDGHPFRAMFGRILATAVRRHAPEHLGLLPPEFLAANDDRNAA
jgi:hypothetical protein